MVYKVQTPLLLVEQPLQQLVVVMALFLTKMLEMGVLAVVLVEKLHPQEVLEVEHQDKGLMVVLTGLQVNMGQAVVVALVL